MLLLQMSNVKQRILSWENAHGQRALGLRRRFNHALLEAAGKRKRHHEMIDLTGDSDDGTSTNSNNDSSPSKTFDLTSPSTTTRKTKKKGRRKTKDRPSKKRKKDKHVPRGSVPERLTDAIFNDPNLLKRYQKTIGTERLARRFLTKEENEALQHVDPLNLEEELDNDLYWTARQKLSKLRTRIFDTTRVRDTYITCQKFGCTTKTDRLDSFCSKHAARHRKHSENDAQYIRLCTSDLEAFKVRSIDCCQQPVRQAASWLMSTQTITHPWKSTFSRAAPRLVIRLDGTSPTWKGHHKEHTTTGRIC